MGIDYKFVSLLKMRAEFRIMISAFINTGLVITQSHTQENKGTTKYGKRCHYLSVDGTVFNCHNWHNEDVSLYFYLF